MRSIASARRTTVRRRDAKGARRFLRLWGTGELDGFQESGEGVFLICDERAGACELEEPDVVAGGGEGDEHAAGGFSVSAGVFDVDQHALAIGADFDVGEGDGVGIADWRQAELVAPSIDVVGERAG